MQLKKLAAIALTFLLPAILQAAPSVTISEDENSFTLANGIVTAQVSNAPAI